MAQQPHGRGSARRLMAPHAWQVKDKERRKADARAAAAAAEPAVGGAAAAPRLT